MEGSCPSVGGLQLLEEVEMLVGKPLRITVWEQNCRERVMRTPGLLEDSSAGEVVALVPETDGLAPSVPLTLEVILPDQTLWFHSRITRVDGNAIYLKPFGEVHTVDRRNLQRFDMELLIQVAGIGSEPTRAQFRDISEGGAAIRLPVPVTVGEKLTLMFSLGSSLLKHDLQGEVVRCMPIGDGTYSVGLMFSLTGDTLWSLRSWVEQTLNDEW